ncbi:ParB N-terminal domain-containing protein [Pseudoalteromonas sp. OF7H-1]|uniref:ParB N-terminal domain-containing protein n=1 Tax=Pseudoalteromonas sp. OF7H-1 TaxID=2917755 RepID=UPI001EF5F21B|nr:ParB N-terminal domain-containing protein [Pseudoalteromonas sp. OF7H-1]MCG7542096.1 ParB N-terminal domain-containing protein [Pseudoalteromonas sp. OF7H-1]
MNALSDETLLLNALNNGPDLPSENFEFKSIFLDSILPDAENARFFPAIAISDTDANAFINRKITKSQLAKQYGADGFILIGKSVLLNCLTYGTTDWKKANESIDSIVELGENIIESDLIQAPTVYPLDSDGRYKIVTGHRRFFALLYANGKGSAAQFKVYDSKPYLLKTKQFVENASREDLSPYGKLQAFSGAMHELDALNNARLKLGGKKLTVKQSASKLGISMGAFDNYNVLTRYSAVAESYKTGLKKTFINVKKIVLDTEKEYRHQYGKKQLNIGDKKEINNLLAKKLTGIEQSLPKAPEKVKLNFSLSPTSIKKLLELNIFKLDTGINWLELDWNDGNQIQKAINQVVELLQSSDNVNENPISG